MTAPLTADPEGYENTSLGNYPIDEVLIRSDNRTVFEIIRRIKQGHYVMDPDFQRDFIWPEDKQSKLIESILMRIPLPVFYLAEDKQGRMIVVDGLQRLSTLQRFLNDELALKLPQQDELNGKRFSELQARLQNRIEDCNLPLYIIDSKVGDQTRLDIFERVNGGIPLTRQQMRNCLYMGPATRWLKAESNTALFIDATGRSLRTDSMRDREFVNRFCAFLLNDRGDYRGQMDEFLAAALTTMNEFDEARLTALSAQFQRGLRNNQSVFGKHAFRKHTDPNAGRNQINASLWDVMCTGLSHYSAESVVEKSVPLRAAFQSLMRDEKFIQSVTHSPNSTNQVRHRFEVAQRMLLEVFGANPA